MPPGIIWEPVWKRAHTQHVRAEPLLTDPDLKSGFSVCELISIKKKKYRQGMNGQTFSQNPRMPGKSHSYQVLILRDPFRDLLLCTLLCMLICCKMQTYIHIATNTSHRVWDIMTQVTRAANAWWTVTEGNNPPPITHSTRYHTHSSARLAIHTLKMRDLGSL